MDRSRTRWDYGSVLRDAWALLENGATSMTAGMHYPVVASRGLDDLPNGRTLLLWRVVRGERLLYFNTDSRSPKHAELARTPWAFLVFYEPSAQTQLRIRVRVRFRRDDALTRQAWHDLPPETRRVFATQAPPGYVAPAPDTLPALEAMDDDPQMNEAGFGNFELLEAKIAHLDWLYISPCGHRRAAFTWISADEPEARWLYP